jgi:hypothetical protein
MGKFLLILCSIPMFADTYKVTKITMYGQETILAEYLQGKNYRVESQNQAGTRAVSIQTFDTSGPPSLPAIQPKAMYELDLESRKYTEIRYEPDFILVLAKRIARPPRVLETGKTVNIYYETVDTGERKQFFGQTAKHLVIRERHAAEPNACEASFQTEKDGWYIPKNGIREMAYKIVISNGVVCRDIVVKHGDPTPPGIAVLETDGRVAREVLELSTAPLDRSLFEVPSGFEKVDALPGRPAQMSSSQRRAWEWAQLEQAFQSWFRWSSGR